MTEETPETQVPDEAAVAQALGLNPATLQAGSLKIIYDGGEHPLVMFTQMVRVPTAALGKAMLISAASAPVEEPEDKPATLRAVPAKKTAKKTTTRKK